MEGTIKEITGRLPYGPKVKFNDSLYIVEGVVNVRGVWFLQLKGHDGHVSVSDCTLYLRPMESMAGEEKKGLLKLVNDPYGMLRFSEVGLHFKGRNTLCLPYNAMDAVMDFCHSRHLDINGLIEKGLALEAHENIYPSTLELTF